MTAEERNMLKECEIDAMRHADRHPGHDKSFGVALSDGWHYVCADGSYIGPQGLCYRGNGRHWSVVGVPLSNADRHMMKPTDVVEPMPVGTRA